MRKKLMTLLLVSVMTLPFAVNASAKTIGVSDYANEYRSSIQKIISDIKSDINSLDVKIREHINKIRTETGNLISAYTCEIIEGSTTLTTTDTTTTETQTEPSSEVVTNVEISTETTTENKVYSDFVYKVYELTNVEREKYGAAKLRLNDDLCKAASDHSVDMSNNNYFGHTSLDGRTVADRVRKYADFDYIGENIAMGQRTPEEVLNDWMNSDGHKANILNENYTDIGISYYNGYWVQDFAAMR